MTRRGRLLLFAGGALGVGILLGFALAGLPGFHGPLGPSAELVRNGVLGQRKTTNSVIAVTFDYRSLDTLGEEFILFVAAVGAVVLLRAQRGEDEDELAAELTERRQARRTDLPRAVGVGLAPATVLLGLYIVSHGHLSPGGGFQGGVIVAAPLLFAFVAGRRFVMRGARPHALVELAEAAGAAGFALVGVGGLLLGAVFLDNFLPKGAQGDLLSGGTIPLSNLSVGLEVTGALVLILSELLEQVVLRGGDRS